jgi:hypothetical protein
VAPCTGRMSRWLSELTRTVTKTAAGVLWRPSARLSPNGRGIVLGQAPTLGRPLAFLRDRRAGFELLFRGEPSAPGQRIAQDAMDQVTGEIWKLFRAFNRRSGRPDSPSDALLAAAGVGVARQVCQYELDNGYDLSAAGVVASSFAEAGLRGIDGTVLEDHG